MSNFTNGNDPTGTIRTYLIGGVSASGSIKPFNVDQNGNLIFSGGGGGTSGTSNSSLYSQLLTANDLTKTFNYADAGTPDERIISIHYQSVAMNASFTETYAYSGASGSYRVISTARSQP